MKRENPTNGKYNFRSRCVEYQSMAAQQPRIVDYLWADGASRRNGAMIRST